MSSSDVTSSDVAASFVYLDHAATTPMRPQAILAMMPFLTDQFANPSGSHRLARIARRALDESRERVANLIGCKPGEVVFTGCGSESDNAAIAGTVRRRGGTALCTAAEHHAVLHCVEHLGGTVVDVDRRALVETAGLSAALEGADRESNLITSVAVMAVNNEVGSIADLAGVARIVKRAAPDAVLHTDAVQAACWIDLREIWPHVDTMALSAHKFGGPKGVGILVVREGITFEPIIRGGGQERDRRSGTHNLAGIVATAEALSVTDAERNTEIARISALRRRLIASLQRDSGAHLTVDSSFTVPGVVHVCFREVESEALLYLLDEAGVCASAASACASGAMEPSHVLAAMGVERDLAMGALRLSLGHTTTDEDIDRACAAIVAAVDRLTGAGAHVRSRS